MKLYVTLAYRLRILNQWQHEHEPGTLSFFPRVRAHRVHPAPSAVPEYEVKRERMVNPKLRPRSSSFLATTVDLLVVLGRKGICVVELL